MADRTLTNRMADTELKFYLKIIWIYMSPFFDPETVSRYLFRLAGPTFQSMTTNESPPVGGESFVCDTSSDVKCHSLSGPHRNEVCSFYVRLHHQCVRRHCIRSLCRPKGLSDAFYFIYIYNLIQDGSIY